MSGGDSLTVIAPGGDLILQVSQDDGGTQFSFRVDSTTLQQNSRYFENLLSDRFSEGQNLLAALNALKIAGSSVADAPADALHRIQIVNVGRIAISKASSIRNLVADFLRAVHTLDLAVASPPVANLANLAILADRFDAVSSLTKYVHRKKYLQLIDSRSKGKASPALHEERARQKLLVGLLFDYPVWVMRYSKHLIMKDSIQWRPDVEEDHTKALWWDIPNRVEDEMIHRREYVLETINSLQSHFLKLYTSGERQCKLGYDSSLQCDSFQLGEMIRFFTKINTLRLQGTIYDNSEPTYYSGDIDRLVESLRQASSYQIDRNHAHCGLRTRLIPLLDMIRSQLSLDNGSTNVGICLECWNNQRSLYAWSEAKRPVLWANPKSLTGGRTLADVFWKKERPSVPINCLNRHITVRDFFTATERDWTSKDVF